MASESGVPEPPDRLLLQRAAAGDPDAFTEIFRRYQHVVYRFARAMTGCPAAAEDIAQDVFVVVLRDLGRYDPDRASFTTYLYGVVRNLSRDRLRRERRFFPLDLIAGNRRTTYEVDPADAMAGAALAAEVRLALQRLPPRYREVILLCDVHNLSYEEAAVVVRISIPAVRSRLHRGRQLLRRRLARAVEREARPRPIQRGTVYEL